MKLNPLRSNPTKWSNILKQFVGNLTTKCLSVFDHFVGLALKGLIYKVKVSLMSILTIEQKSLLFQFLTCDIRVQNPIRTGGKNGRISSWKTGLFHWKHRLLKLHLQDERQLYGQFFVDILKIKDECLLF